MIKFQNRPPVPPLSKLRESDLDWPSVRPDRLDIGGYVASYIREDNFPCADQSRRKSKHGKTTEVPLFTISLNSGHDVTNLRAELAPAGVSPLEKLV